MSTMTINVEVSADKGQNMKELVAQQGLSLDSVVEGFFEHALKEEEAYREFRRLADQGNPERGLALIEKMNRIDGCKPLD